MNKDFFERYKIKTEYCGLIGVANKKNISVRKLKNYFKRIFNYKDNYTSFNIEYIKTALKKANNDTEFIIFHYEKGKPLILEGQNKIVIIAPRLTKTKKEVFK